MVVSVLIARLRVSVGPSQKTQDPALPNLVPSSLPLPFFQCPRRMGGRPGSPGHSLCRDSVSGISHCQREHGEGQEAVRKGCRTSPCWILFSPGLREQRIDGK